MSSADSVPLELEQRELFAICGYIRLHYHFYNFDQGIIQLIARYGKPLLFFDIDAIKWSEYKLVDDVEAYKKRMNDEISFAPTKNDPDKCKIVTIGANSVGKTCLLIVYTTNAFPSEYVPTVFDNYVANVRISYTSRTMQVNLLDTAGETWSPDTVLRPLSFPGTDVFMVCMNVYDRYYGQYHTGAKKSGYSLTDLQINTMAFHQEAKAFCPKALFILIGTKIDLRDDEETKEKCYSTEEMQQFATYASFDGYTECSALTSVNLIVAFDYVIRKMIASRKQQKKNDCIIL